jgi:ER lumen protein retaining receptor
LDYRSLDPKPLVSKRKSIVITMFAQSQARTSSNALYVEKEISSRDAAKMTVAAYGGCIVTCCLVFHYIAGQSFSSVLTLSTLTQCLSFALVNVQLQANGSSGVSARTLAVYAFALGFRLSSTLFLDGYLPLDETGNYMHQIGDIGSLGMALYALRELLLRNRRASKDIEGNDFLSVKNMVLSSIGMAILIHPDLNDWATFDILWTAGLYADTVAMIPQLFMISKVGQVPKYTAHFIMAMAVSKLFSAWFWYYGAENIARLHGGFCWSSVAIIVAHAIQFLLLADFGYYYLKAAVAGAFNGGMGMSLPSGVYDI